MSPISYNTHVFKKALATWKYAFCSTSIMFYDILVWAKIKIDAHHIGLKRFFFSLFFLHFFSYLFAAVIDLLQGLLPGVKVPISSKFLFSHLILHFMQWTSAKKIFDLDKKRFCYECLKTWKSYFLAVDPCCWSQHQHAQSCDVDSGTCDFRLDLSRLFYLCKFSFVVHAKCSFPACCMNY